MRELLQTFSLVGALWCCLQGDRDCLDGRYARAERRITRGLALVRKAGSRGTVLRIRLLNSLGIVRKNQQRYDHCEHTYRSALRLAKRGIPDDHPLFACLWHNLAGLEHARERYSVAEPLARQGLSMRERTLGDSHPDVARDVEALAAILDGQGRHEEAEAMHVRALRIFHKGTRKAERREQAHALGNLAACLHLMGRPEALQVARKAVSMQIVEMGAEHPEVKVALANLEQMEGSVQNSS